MKEEEQRKEKDSPELVRQRWSDGDGAAMERRRWSNVRERSRTGGVKGEEVESRRG
jgi:hypothetical protein